MRYWMLMIRWWIGSTFLKKEVWYTRTVTDADSYEELSKWTEQMNRKGWQDVAAIGETLYLRRWVNRYRKPRKSK